MKKLGILLIGLLVATPVFAQEEKSPLDVARVVIDYLEPSVDTLYILKNSDVSDGELAYGLAANLYRQTHNDVSIGSLKLGYIPEANHRYYGSLNADLKGLARLYAPEFIRPEDGSLYDKVLATADKYGAFGLMLGYDFENEDSFWGPSVGIRVAF